MEETSKELVKDQNNEQDKIGHMRRDGHHFTGSVMGCEVAVTTPERDLSCNKHSCKSISRLGSDQRKQVLGQEEIM